VQLFSVIFDDIEVLVDPVMQRWAFGFYSVRVPARISFSKLAFALSEKKVHSPLHDGGSETSSSLSSGNYLRTIPCLALR